MSEHTPSTTDVRLRFERCRTMEAESGADGVTPVTPGEFDRWHAAEVRRAKAEALREAEQDVPSVYMPDESPAQWLNARADRIEITDG